MGPCESCFKFLYSPSDSFLTLSVAKFWKKRNDVVREIVATELTYVVSLRVVVGVLVLLRPAPPPHNFVLYLLQISLSINRRLASGLFKSSFGISGRSHPCVVSRKDPKDIRERGQHYGPKQIPFRVPQDPSKGVAPFSRYR